MPCHWARTAPGVWSLVDDATGAILVTVVRVGTAMPGDRVRYQLKGPATGPTVEFASLEDAQRAAGTFASNGGASRSEARQATRK